MELAKEGFSILLISRTQSKLDELEAEMAKTFPLVQFKTLAIDYSKFDDKAQEAVKAKLQEIDLAILVNNVGVAYEFPKYFDEMTSSEVNDMIRINCDSTTIMSHLALPAMLKRKGGSRRGAIINIASAAGLNSMPLLSLYSAAKAYVRLLSEGMAAEYKPKGIDIQVQTPYYIVSKLSKLRHSSLSVPSSKAYAQDVVRNIGYETVSNPHPIHAIMGFFISQVLPVSIGDQVIMSMHLPIRARGLKKAGVKKEQ